MFNAHVVCVHVSPRLGDDEAALRGLRHESQLDPFSALFWARELFPVFHFRSRGSRSLSSSTRPTRARWSAVRPLPQRTGNCVLWNRYRGGVWAKENARPVGRAFCFQHLLPYSSGIANSEG